MLAPMGSGALWARRELLEAMPPFLAGGEMIREVHLRRSEFNEIPWKFEAGTPAVGDAIGLGVAAEYLMDIGMDAVREHERELVAYALEALPREVPAIELYGPMDAGRAGRRHPVQPARASTRTTSRRCWTGSGSPSGPVTTARCRCTSGSTWRPRLGRRSASTRRRDDIDALAAGLQEVQRVFNGRSGHDQSSRTPWRRSSAWTGAHLEPVERPVGPEGDRGRDARTLAADGAAHHVPGGGVRDLVAADRPPGDDEIADALGTSDRYGTWKYRPVVGRMRIP